MLTRAQYSTPKNPNLPLIIYREGEPVSKLIKLCDNGEQEQFLKVMSTSVSEKTHISKRKPTSQWCFSDHSFIDTPEVKVVQDTICSDGCKK